MFMLEEEKEEKIIKPAPSYEQKRQIDIKRFTGVVVHNGLNLHFNYMACSNCEGIKSHLTV